MTTPSYHPQHVRRRCNTATFEAAERGDKNFEIFVGDDVRLEIGDLLTLEEWDPTEKNYTGRRVTRKISYALNTQDSKIPAEEVNRYGITVYSMVHPDFHSLEALLYHKYIFAVILEKSEEDSYKILTGPFYVPAISSPQLYEMGILDEFKIESWPSGIYDISLMVGIDLERQRFVVIDHLISGVVATEEDPSSELPPVENVSLSLLDLKAGKTRSLAGKMLQMADPEEAKALDSEENMIEEVHEDDFPEVVGSLQDGMTQDVEEELERLLHNSAEE